MSNLRIVALLGFAPMLAFAGVDEGLQQLQEGNAQNAAQEFQTAYDEGDGDGAFYLGRMFEMGAGAQADPTRAANLYAAGVEKGSTLAMNRLGVMYLEGNVLLRDYVEAARLFCQAADAGDAEGELNCGMSYQLGRGVEQDSTKALEYLNKASEQGNIAAQNILGEAYMTGEGVEQDQAKAVEYFQKTADAGNAMGLFQLATYYSQGDAPDLPLAYSYASLAAVRGLPSARTLRDQLEGQMTPEQVTQGQAKAKAWTEEKLQGANAQAAEETEAEGES